MAKRKNATAFAPYNFVPLNDEVLPAKMMDYLVEPETEKELQKAKQDAYKEFIKDEKKYDGYINIALENLTPLYIELEDKMFSIGEKVCIPGSSLRGCIKNLFKIVTNSSFRADEDNADFNNTHLYFRSLASTCRPWREHYNAEMPMEKVKLFGEDWILSKSEGGFLFLNKVDNRYYIAPAELIYNLKNGRGQEPSVEWVLDYQEANVYSGRFPKKQVYYTVKNPRFDQAILVEDEVMRGYVDDTSREGLNLLDEGGITGELYIDDNINIKYIVPCFYIREKIKGKDRVKHFGSCKCYRIPYQKAIADQVPQILKEGPIDFTETMFGNKELWASRVVFEDAYIEDGTENVFAKKAVSKPLLSPKPTSFQLYLEPKKGDAQHWDSKTTQIRGYKMYWHKTCDWKASRSDEIGQGVKKEMEPVGPGKKFNGKIRFKNLDKVELGALLTTLEIAQEENKALKLGMGKPLGMGSIKISTELFIQGEFYYMQLFNDDRFMGAEKVDSSEYKEAFIAYAKEKLGDKYKNYKDRIDILRKMIDASKLEKGAKSWKQKTRYMEYGNEEDVELYKEKAILPSADELFEY